MPRKKTLTAPPSTFPIVGVGASAGGLEAFRSLLQTLPANTGMAFVFVQHLDPAHESLLTKLLSHATRMPVMEVTEGTVVEPNHVYVIPPNTSMGIRGGILHLLARKRQDGIKHMPVDHFLESLAENEGSRAIGVILSGVATDGTLGLTAIKAAGGITFAQDGKSARYDGMPRSAVAAGCVDFVFSPEGIARELRRISLHPYLGVPDRQTGGTSTLAHRDDGLRKIFALLRNATGIDFTHYKRSTINRRIARRMVLRKISRVPQYLKLLHDNADELTDLYEDILIHVTGFFREPETFRALKDTILPKLLRHRAPREPLRIWVAGCSTGEEVYSIAICVLEYLRSQNSSVPVQIFATDVSETALERARAGLYSESAMAGLSRERVRQFFVRSDGGYQIIKTVREVCVFARQDLAKDPPYSRLDLLTCRNVLIYMEPVLQKRIMTIFHYALKPAGFLVLGKSESISGFSELFTPVGRKRKIYTKKSSNTRPDLPAAPPKQAPPETLPRPDVPPRFDPQKEADRIVMNHYAPAGLVASDDLQILHFRGNVAPYLAPSPGRASLGLLRMVQPEFAADLRAAIHRARKQQRPVRKDGILVKRNGHVNELSLEVVPFKGDAGQWFFLVLFQETRAADAEVAGTGTLKAKSARDGGMEAARLRRELQSTKEHLQSIIEEHEATNEELKSANEEVLSSNEELQSTNEELETAQEELQSTNEELVTTNEQLQNRNQELSQLSDDWSNLLSGLNIPIVMLGNDRRIRRFTSPAEKLLNLLPSDIGRPINNIRPNLKVPDLDRLITDVIDKVAHQELDLQDRDGRWYSMRLRPYRTADRRIDGVLIIFIDIHVLKTTQEALRQQNSFSTAVMESSGALVMVTGAEGRVVAFNRACQIASGYKLEEIAGKVIWDSSLLPKEEIDGERSVYRRLIAGRAPIQHESHWLAKDGGSRLISWNSAAVSGGAGHQRFMVRIGTDVTENREMEAALKARDLALRQSQTQLQALAAGLLSAQEEERSRVARELHDDISQKLVTLNLEAESVLRKESETPGKLRAEMTRLLHRLRGILRDVEQTAYRLHPSSLDHLGLSVALKSYCADFGKHNGIAMSCTERNMPRNIAPRLGLTIYRVAQEALRNVVKHSGARRAMVSVSGKNGAIVLTVKDYGRGFDASRPKKRGLGLISMEERVRQAGGVFTVKSTPGTGVRIDVRIPIPHKAGKALESEAHASPAQPPARRRSSTLSRRRSPPSRK